MDSNCENATVNDIPYNRTSSFTFPSSSVPIKKRHLCKKSSFDTSDNVVSAKEAKITQNVSASSESRVFYIESLLGPPVNENLPPVVSEKQSSPNCEQSLSPISEVTNYASNEKSETMEKFPPFFKSTSPNTNAKVLSPTRIAVPYNVPVFDEKSLPSYPEIKCEQTGEQPLPVVNEKIIEIKDRPGSTNVIDVEDISDSSSSDSNDSCFVLNKEDRHIVNKHKEKSSSISQVGTKSSCELVSDDDYSNSETDTDSLPILDTSKKIYSVANKPKKSFSFSEIGKFSNFIDLTEDDAPEPFPVARTSSRKPKIIDLTSDEDADVTGADVKVQLVTKHLQVCPIVAEFVLQNFYTIGGSNVMPFAIKAEKAFGGFKITGSSENIAKAEKVLRNVKWFGEEISYCCPQLSTHFRSDAWTDFKKVVESEIRGAIGVKFQSNDNLDESRQSDKKSTSTSQNKAVKQLQPYGFNDLSESSLLDNILDDEIPKIQPKVVAPFAPQSTTSTDIPLLLDESAKLTNYGDIKVIVCQGDITEDYSAAIVNGVMPNFDLTAGAVSHAIITKGGPQLTAECAHQINNDLGPFVRVTNGYGLYCKHVIHLVTPNTLEEYAPRILLALHTANNMRLPSLAIPSIGTGGINLNPMMVAQCMAQAFEQFARFHDSHLKTIKVVIYEESLLQTFISHIITIKNVQRYGFNKVLSLEAQNKTMALSDYVVVSVKSDRSVSAIQAKERILTHMTKHVCQRKVEDKIVAKLGDHDCIDIYEASIRHSVKVEYNQGIILLGISDRVTEMNEFIRELWCELREAETLAKITSWKWEVGPQNFVMLPLRVSRAMEQCYEQNNLGRHDVRLYGDTVQIDFANMTYKFHDNMGRIVRIGAEASALSLPVQWLDMAGRAMTRVLLHSSCPEYQRVHSLFMLSNPRVKHVEKIERVQNVALYRQYQVMKSHVTKRLISNNPVERELFHGTNEEDANKICAHGFDRGFAGKNATAYGRGSYFATTSSYSVGFAKKGRGCRRGYIFLALVLTGDYELGSSDMRSPPEKWTNGEERLLFDSVVDNLNNPQMFVVFKDSSVYPSYLIVFS